MTPTSVGKQEWWGYERALWINILSFYCVKIVAPFCLVSEVVYVIANHNTLTFDTFGTILAIFPVACVVNLCIFSTWRSIYKKVMIEFMTKIHLQNYKHHGEYVAKQLYQVERLTRNAAYFLCGCLSLDWLAWFLIPIYNNHRKIDEIHNMTLKFETSVYFWAPFDYQNNLKYWIFMHTVNVYVTGLACAIVSLFNTLNYAFVFHLIGHIKILKYKIRTRFDKLLNDRDIRNELVEVIKYHNFIINVHKDLQSAFGLNVTANYMHNLLGDSLLLYQVMFGDKGNLLTYGFMFLVYMGGLILMSFVLEQIKRESDGLSDEVYGIPWQNMSVSNQKVVLMLLAHVQPTMEFKAAGGMRAGVRPMLSIVKSTFSYYLMLKQSM